jgi:hypothetical protein
MQAAAFTPKHVNPAAQLLGDAVGQRLHPVLDRTFVRIDLAVGIGDEQGALGEELHDPAGVGPWPVGRQRPDVRFVDRGVAYPGQHVRRLRAASRRSCSSQCRPRAQR